MKAHCTKCNTETNHKHECDTAHGIPESYMPGSERFTCTECNYITFKSSDTEKRFKFFMEK
jgi:hypothetical protein